MGKRYLVILCSVMLGLAAAPAVRAEPAASVTGINGTPMLIRHGASEKLVSGAGIEVGDEITTDATAKVQIQLADESVLTIGPDTRVKLDEFRLGTAARQSRLSVFAGRFKLAVEKFVGTTDYRIETPTAVAGVRGTVIWGDTQLDTICALEGHVEVNTRKGTAVAEFGAGNCVHDMAAGKTTPLVPTAEQLAGYLKLVTLD
jgi:hypothetical protein